MLNDDPEIGDVFLYLKGLDMIQQGELKILQVVYEEFLKVGLRANISDVEYLMNLYRKYRPVSNPRGRALITPCSLERP